VRRLLSALACVAVIGIAVARAAIPVVDDCAEANYLDRSGPAADRALHWDYSFAGDPERCLKIRVGQSVQWEGNFGDHPLEGHEGDRPNPIDSHADGLVRFDRPGIFGFRCNFHLEMRGAIWVVADNAPAVPSGSTRVALLAMVLLLMVGLGVLAGRRLHSAPR
jgi:plastocyanin